MKMKRKILCAGVAFSSLLLAEPASAAVTPQGWWHYGEVTDYYADSSGNNRRFNMAFSRVGGGNAGAGIAAIGAGGPLGSSGWTSTSAVYWTPTHADAAGMWFPSTSADAAAAWNPPQKNYVIECWLLPEETGISTTANRTWFFGSGSGDFSQPDRPAGTGAGGVYFAITNNADLGYSEVGAFVIPNAAQGVPDTVQIGDTVPATTNSWMHVAVVNDNGINTFYVNGVKQGASTDKNTIPNGNIFAGCTPGTVPSFRGYLDELRISTFEPGQFALGDLLLRPAGPSITVQPQSATVWAGGAASFGVTAVIDSGLTYQWRREGVNIAGATESKLYLPLVTAADNGAKFDCVLKSGGVTLASAAATLTIVTPTSVDLGNAAAYRNIVKGESSLVAYYPADDCTTATVINLIDAAYNGTLEGKAGYDGQTNRALIQRALAFDGDGDVQIPYNAEFEFGSGDGTVEALIYLNHASAQNQTIFSLGYDSTWVCYAFMANGAGDSLLFWNGTETLNWPVPSLIGRRAHVAFVIDDFVNITPYVNGQPLDTKVQTAFGPGGAPAFIGALGAAYGWAGTIGELAVYKSALSPSAIQAHYTKYVYGTTVAPPEIVTQTTGPRTLFAGGSPTLTVTVKGALPFTYQWKSNGVAIAGATAASMTLPKTDPTFSAAYSVTVANVFGTVDSAPIALTFTAPTDAYSTAVMNDGPLAYFRLNETGGAKALDSAGFNDAKFNGAMTLGANGVVSSDTAILFTGGNAEAPYSPALNNPAGPFTLEFWAKPSDSGLWVPVASQYRTGSRAGYCIYQNNGGANWVGDLGIVGNTGVNRFTGATVPPAPGVWSYVVFTYDGTTASFYVEGRLEDSGAIAMGSGFTPNPSSAFLIGDRNGGGLSYKGTIDEVAVYDYALTPEQITSHWSFIWTPSAIVTQPTDVSAVEGSTVTLTASASGYPNTYQWYKGAAALADVNNPDGTAHYSGGVASPTLTITQATPSDAGLYHLLVTNPRGNSTSADARVTVTKDTAPPTIVSVTALSTPKPDAPMAGMPYLVKVLFSKRMDTTSAQSAANYTISGGVTINPVSFLGNATAARLGSDWRTAVLATGGLTPGQKYTLTVTGLKDQTVTGNPLASTTVSFQAPVLTTGVAAWDYYYLGAPRPSPLDVYWLLNSTYYPFGPNTNGLPTAFDTSAFTGGDLATKPAFGSLGEDYGDSLSGWITPAVSGSYRFFISSDDPSQLFLSSDDSPVNAVIIAEETGCCRAFTEPPAAYTSEPQPLVAGQKYFLQAIHTEGGGGDYLKVAWRLEGDATPAAQLTPISGSVLSAYAPVPPPVFNAPTITQTGQVTISWTGTGTLEQSADFGTWTTVPGNPGSPYTVAPTAPALFYRLVQ